MSDEVLEPGTVVVDNSLVVRRHAGRGYRIAYRRALTIASEDEETWAFAGWCAARIGRETPAVATYKIALIGGGFCVIAKALWYRLSVTIFEMEAAFERYKPPWPAAVFVPGDWRTTFPPLADTFHCVIFDVDEPIENSGIETMVRPGCLILHRGIRGD